MKPNKVKGRKDLLAKTTTDLEKKNKIWKLNNFSIIIYENKILTLDEIIRLEEMLVNLLW